jgi:hypothetical protein
MGMLIESAEGEEKIPRTDLLDLRVLQAVLLLFL